ncbi:MAG: ribulose-phosphate 3-epimerase [Planctomycetaceae bacterium]|nr:ribulose-phosphate 3-epimerase [Planctomycetaceae bacterium]
MSSHQQLERLRRATPAVLPSLLMCDFANLQQEVQRLEQAQVKALHLDVMDGQFVPNLSYGMPIIAAIRRVTDLPLDVHLMVERPGRYIKDFVDSGADLITIHIEATDDPRRDLSEIRKLGCGVGLSLNPDTPLAQIEPFVELCDLVLVMSVNAGFGGQSFNPVALEKLKCLRKQSQEDLILEVDGGVNTTTMGSCAEAGADLFVVGSAIFREPDYASIIRELETLAQRQ